MAVDIKEDLMRELGLENVDEQKKNEIIDKMSTIILDRMSVRMADVLTKEELDEFDNISASSDQQKALAYLAEKFPNYDMMVMEEVEKLKAELSQQTAEIMDLVNKKPVQQ
jgi:hypothetical protein